ncbi:hypothetical protein ACUXZZ_22155 [Streptomyces graminifolii]|uniref:hypothetical protein n=1 Tax=Streptomyces graminifolii TaxID=1266771 RepID=UPI00405887C9
MSANGQETVRYFALEGARTLRLWNAGEDGGRDLYEIAAQLHLATDLLAHGPVGEHPSPVNSSCDRPGCATSC